jgi:hypothetical protein
VFRSAHLRIASTLLLVLIVLCVICRPVAALATTYVVDPNNPLASDANSGTEAEPFATLERGLSVTQHGDTLIFRPGVGSTSASVSGGQQIGPGAAASEAGSISPRVLGIVAGVGGLLLVAVVGVLVYFLVMVPGRRRRPLVKVLQELERGEDPTTLADTEQVLVNVAASGLKRDDLRVARFALAYVRARLGRYSEASSTLDDLVHSGDQSLETTYLRLWVDHHMDDPERVERTYLSAGEFLLEILDARLVVGIALLKRARSLWRERLFDAAVEYFNRLRELDVLTEAIPKRMDDHRIALGFASLYDNDLSGAREQFNNVVRTVHETGASDVPARLGLLLATWRESECPDVDGELGALVKTMQESETVGASERESGGPISGAGGGVPGEDELLLRNLLLLHAISLLHTWRRLTERSGMPAGGFEALNERLKRVEQTDPAMVDPRLLRGLIGYYFAIGSAERDQALADLESALEGGVHLPEVIDLVERERRLDVARERAMERFLAIVRDYLADRGIPVEVRRVLQERLKRLSRFESLTELELDATDIDAAPSIVDLQARSALLSRHVRMFVSADMERGDTEVARLIEALGAETERVRRSADALDQAEQDVMVFVGEYLLAEQAEPTCAAPELPAVAEEGRQPNGRVD